MLLRNYLASTSLARRANLSCSAAQDFRLPGCQVARGRVQATCILASTSSFRRRTCPSTFAHSPLARFYARRCNLSSEPLRAASLAASAPLLTEGWPLWSALFVCAAAGQLAEQHLSLGPALSASLVTVLLGVALAALGIIPADCASYGVIWHYLMPLAAACFLLETDLPRLVREGGTVLLSFLIGAAGMMAGALLGFRLVGPALGPEGAKLAACLCASYIGGTINFVGVAKAVALSPAGMSSAMATDNLGMALCLALMTAMPVNTLRKLLTSKPAAAAASMEVESAVTGAPPPPPMTTYRIVTILAAAAAATATSRSLAATLGWQNFTLMLTAAIAAAMNALPGLLGGREGGPAPRVFEGASQLGASLMMVFFVIVGASAGSLAALAASTPAKLVLICVMVAVHWAVLLLGGRLLRLPAEAVLLGSNACIGGPGTAAGMAASYGWSSLTQPALLTATLGYAVGTAAGLIVARVVC